MVPAFGMVISPQNLSTGNVQVPGWSCILSEDIFHISDIRAQGEAAGAYAGGGEQRALGRGGLGGRKTELLTQKTNY